MSGKRSLARPLFATFDLFGLTFRPFALEQLFHFRGSLLDKTAFRFFRIFPLVASFFFPFLKLQSWILFLCPRGAKKENNRGR